nr:PDZ domain-containing protein [Rhodopirellula sp. JC639]
MLSATVFGQGAESREPEKQLSIRPEACRLELAGNSQRESASQKPFSPARRWILGVRCKPTTAGCVVTSVVPGSAAERAGLIAGDRILTVDGTQVGWHGDRLTPLHQAVDAAPSRRVRLLVQRAESGLIRPLPATLHTMLEALGH